MARFWGHFVPGDLSVAEVAPLRRRWGSGESTNSAVVSSLGESTSCPVTDRSSYDFGANSYQLPQHSRATAIGAARRFASGLCLLAFFAVVLWSLPRAAAGSSTSAVVGARQLASPPVRANTTFGGSQSVGPASRASVDGSGRFVAFHSPASDLVPGDTNGVGDVFVTDTWTGAIERLSVDLAGSQANGRSTFAQISESGDLVVFQSAANNLVPGDTNGKTDIFVKHRITGVVERVSVASDGSQANGESRFAQITPDGRYVVFQSEASNLVPGDTNNSWDVFIRDRLLGRTERVSVSSQGLQGNNYSVRPSVSSDGCKVVYHSWASNLVGGDTNGKADVFLHDRCSGRTTTRVSVPSTGTQANGDSQFPKISGDGGVVAFHSTASNLVPGDTNGVRDTFVKVLSSGATERVSVSSSAMEADGQTGFASVSADGRYVFFHGVATNLDPYDTNGVQDVFVRDRISFTTKLVSWGAGGTLGNDASGSPYCSPSGAYVVYQSRASNLVPNDTNGQQDVFIASRP